MTASRAVSACVVALLVVCAEPARAPAADLYTAGGWPALASDHLAERVGDSLTIIINEAASGANSTQSGSHKTTHVAAGVAVGGVFNKSAEASLGGAYDGAGQTGRSGSMVAQISVVVDAVLPNGDLHVAGERLLDINGEKANIRIKGRIRRTDISTLNTILSSQLADASIDYNGAGFTSRSAKPGIVTRIFGWMGLL